MRVYGYVYMTINIKNHKRYIGQHKSLQFDPKYRGSGKVLKDAFKKYTKPSDWKVEVLEECKNADMLDKREEYWIAYYNAVEDKNFYNILKGGSKNSYIVSKQTKEKISTYNKGTLFVNKDSINKRIKKEELDKYLSEGWIRGQVQNRNTYNRISKAQKKRFKDPKERAKCGASRLGTKAVFKDSTTKYVKLEELDKYLSEGWQLGSLSGRGRVQTQEEKDRRAKSLHKAYKSKELRKRQSEIQKKLHKEYPDRFKHTQEIKDKISKLTKEALASKKEKMSLAAKRRWNNIEERQKQSERIKSLNSEALE